jgi:hypothetical protein
MKHMMLSCSQATLLMEKGSEIPLTRMERIRLSFHTGMCDGCRNYRKQSDHINSLIAKLLGDRRIIATDPVEMKLFKELILRQANSY